MSETQSNREVLQDLLNRMQSREQRPDRTTDIVSRFAYLIGVRENIFRNEHEAPDPEIYRKLEKERSARIIRNLCLLRLSIEQNFGRINEEARTRGAGLLSMSEHIPQAALRQLSDDGVEVLRNNRANPAQAIMEINRLIGDRINNCRNLFPTWLNWEYLKALFIMPNGLTQEGIREEAGTYFQNRRFYPYQVYMNWNPHDCGNLLSSDRKFVQLLYEWNNDRFTQLNKVEDAGEYITESIYDFIENGSRVIFFVDCENSDPYNLCAALMSFDEAYSRKIDRVILFDDVHASTAWRVIEDHIPIPVEHILVERLKENKSRVDMSLGLRVSKEFYGNSVDAFVIVSSDSDFWSVVTDLPEAKFLFMIEHGKCGPDMKAALEERGIFYCFIDEFHSVRSEGIMQDALFREMLRYMEEHLHFNFQDMFDHALTAARANMTETEKRQFFDKHIRPFQAGIDENGGLRLTLKR